jgi:hypothetical protein
VASSNGERAMKMFVITNADGKVIGSYRPNAVQYPKAPVFKPVASSAKRQTVHEIDVSTQIAEIQSADELHKALQNLVH